MSDNTNLILARQSKYDEFYTRMVDIDKEVPAYQRSLRGKRIYCPCDNPRTSNFFKHFVINFRRYQLHSVVASCYSGGGNGRYARYDRRGLIERSLEGDGDYRSDECNSILAESDVVVSNPPFSLARDFFTWVATHDKSYLLIANVNLLQTSAVFPSVKAGRCWTGTGRSAITFEFDVPCEYRNSRLDGGTSRAKLDHFVWLTNMDHGNRFIDLELTRRYEDGRYDDYTNYDAIDVPRIADIPVAYWGKMGVPIHFFIHHNPRQFTIHDVISPRLIRDGREVNIYSRVIIQRVRP